MHVHGTLAAVCLVPITGIQAENGDRNYTEPNRVSGVR